MRGPGGGGTAGTGDADDAGLGFLLVPGQSAGTLGAEVADGTVVRAAVLGGRGRQDQVDPAAAADLLDVRVGDGPRTVEIEGLGAYRVLAVDTPDGSVLVTGLPLDEVTGTSASLVGILLVATVAGCAVVLLAGGLVRRAAPCARSPR